MTENEQQRYIYELTIKYDPKIGGNSISDMFYGLFPVYVGVERLIDFRSNVWVSMHSLIIHNVR